MNAKAIEELDKVRKSLLEAARSDAYSDGLMHLAMHVVTILDIITLHTGKEKRE